MTWVEGNDATREDYFINISKLVIKAQNKEFENKIIANKV